MPAAERTATRIVVRGTPATQGSKRHVGNGIMVEASKKTRPWRSDVRSAVEDTYDGPPLEGPLHVWLTFVFERPKGHWRTGRNSYLLKDSAPSFPAGKRDDIDKLARAVLDACTSAGLWGDDGQVVGLSCSKVYVGAGKAITGGLPDGPGVVIEVDVDGHDCEASLWGALCSSCGRPSEPFLDEAVPW